MRHDARKYMMTRGDEGRGGDVEGKESKYGRLTVVLSVLPPWSRTVNAPAA